MGMELRDAVTAAALVNSAYKSDSAQSQNNSTQFQKSEAPSSLSSVQGTQNTQAEDLLKKDSEEQQKDEEKGQISQEALSELVDEANKFMSNTNCNLEVSYNDKADVLNVKMIDKETNKVIKEFPPEEMIENMIKAKEWLGAFIDKMA